MKKWSNKTHIEYSFLQKKVPWDYVAGFSSRALPMYTDLAKKWSNRTHITSRNKTDHDQHDSSQAAKRKAVQRNTSQCTTKQQEKHNAIQCFVKTPLAFLLCPWHYHYRSWRNFSMRASCPILSCPWHDHSTRGGDHGREGFIASLALISLLSMISSPGFTK